MNKQKDEQRSVELEQNLNSTTKADDTTSSSHNAKPLVVRSFSCPEGTIEVIERTCPLDEDLANSRFEPRQKIIVCADLKNHQVQS